MKLKIEKKKSYYHQDDSLKMLKAIHKEIANYVLDVLASEGMDTSITGIDWWVNSVNQKIPAAVVGCKFIVGGEHSDCLEEGEFDRIAKRSAKAVVYSLMKELEKEGRIDFERMHQFYEAFLGSIEYFFEIILENAKEKYLRKTSGIKSCEPFVSSDIH
jgi:hypothetical protein